MYAAHRRSSAVDFASRRSVSSTTSSAAHQFSPGPLGSTLSPKPVRAAPPGRPPRPPHVRMRNGRQTRTTLGSGPLRVAAAWLGGADKEIDAGLADACRPAQFGELGGKLGRRVEDLDHPVLAAVAKAAPRSEEHTSELQSHHDLVCRLLLEKKKK